MSQLYLDKSDEEIIGYIRKNDREALDYILNKYKNLVRKKARKLFLIGGDRDDLIQEGMIGLYKAVRDYDAGKESSFRTFAERCISTQIYDAIKASNRKKNIPLNTYISFHALSVEEDADFLFADNKENPEALIIDRENVDFLEQEMKQRLSPFEQEVVNLYLEGLTYLEIAAVLKREPKSIDNALQRIKNKLSKIQKNTIDK